MNSLKLLLATLFLCTSFATANAQYLIEPAEGYSPNIGTLVDMMENLKERITMQVKDLDQEQTDFLFDEKANCISALIMHLVATEAYYQVETLESRSWTKKEEKQWGPASSLSPKVNQQLQGKPISYYLELWDEVRAKSLTGLKTKDDAWLASNPTGDMNNYFAWFHVIEHMANHMGQIALVKNRLPK